MSIDNTQHLSKLSRDEVKSVYEKWPNPLIPLGFMMGGIVAMMAALAQHNQGEGSFASLVGAFVVFIALTLGSSIYGLVKVSKAKRLLNAAAQKHSLPEKELLKEFRKNLKHIKAL